MVTQHTEHMNTSYWHKFRTVSFVATCRKFWNLCAVLKTNICICRFVWL